MKLLFALTAVLMLSACGGNVDLMGGYLAKFDNPQNKAGYNETVLKWATVKTGEFTQEQQMNFLYLLNAQESGSLSLEIALSDGTIYKFEGTDLQSFGAFETRAGVETAIAEVLGDLATPENIGALVTLFSRIPPVPLGDP